MLAGLFYAVLFFGTDSTLLIFGALAGLLVTLCYVLLSALFEKQDIKKASLGLQYISRIVAFGLLFLLAFVLISFLHAVYSYQLSGYPVQNILAEDYFPLWHFYVLYAMLASAVFQSLWLYNIANNKSYQFGKITNRETTALLVSVTNNSHQDSNTENIKVLNSIYNKLQLQYENCISQLEVNTMIIVFSNVLAEAEKQNITGILREINLTHISDSQKMLQIQFGFADGDIQVQQCGTQYLISGQCVNSAKNNLQILNTTNAREFTGTSVLSVTI